MKGDNQMKQIIIATHNPGKAEEFKDLFSHYNIKAQSLLDIPANLPDIEETGHTFSENAALKAQGIASIVKQPVLADDSGLMIDALDGRPGIFSARYAGEDKNDEANIQKVLNELKGVNINNRTARFICVLALAHPNEETIFKTGYCEGTIGFTTVGTKGFGYDPIFIPKGHKRTMAEMSMTEKGRLSHRSAAMVQLETWLKGSNH